MTALLSRARGAPQPGGIPEPPNDREASLLGRPMPADRVRAFWATLVVAVIGAAVRFQDLGSPTDHGSPIFDGKHYAPQAWQMLRNGGWADNAAYELIVHPPLGKQLIAIGEWLFGYNGFGWRFSSAVAGTLIIIMIVRIARRLSRSTLLGVLAGILAICGGVLHVQSRMAMLDIFLTAFVVAAFACLLKDRDQVRERLAAAVREGWAWDSAYGPKLGFRWWRFGTGVLLGLATGVKWSGAYWVVGFGLLILFFDVAARKAAGVQRPWAGMLRRDLLPAVWAIGLVSVLVYLSTWWAWFGSVTATDRHYIAIHDVPAGPFAWLPDSLRSLVAYTVNVLEFHMNLETPENNPHPWESKPWTWPMGLRPMLYYYESGEAAAGCGGSECVRAIMLIGTPAMWWLALPMLAWGLWRSVFRRDWRYAAVLTAYFSGLLPWFANLDRQMYFFYATPLAPFLILGITLSLGHIMGGVRNGYERRGAGMLVVAVYVGMVVANFVWLWPILNGESITNERWQAELWLPSWR